METETTTSAWKLNRGQVITRHPNHPDVTGVWTVIGQPKLVQTVVTIPVSMLDGGEDVFVVDFAASITIRDAKTYILTALFTADQREAALLDLTVEECRFVTGALMQGYAEVFDAIVALLDRPGVRENLANPPAAPKSVTS